MHDSAAHDIILWLGGGSAPMLLVYSLSFHHSNITDTCACSGPLPCSRLTELGLHTWEQHSSKAGQDRKIRKNKFSV